MRFSHSIFVYSRSGRAARGELSKIEKVIYPCAPAQDARPITIFPKKPPRPSGYCGFLRKIETVYLKISTPSVSNAQKAGYESIVPSGALT